MRGNIEQYFGTGLVTEAIAKQDNSLCPHVAIQTAASSGAHLAIYSNENETSKNAGAFDRRDDR